jgi:hypothetical protein
VQAVPTNFRAKMEKKPRIKPEWFAGLSADQIEKMEARR